VAKQYANHKSHAIHAALMGYYRFANLDQAKLQLQILRDSYFISRHALHPDTPESTYIWVRGYELSEEDKKQGLLGHFVKITCHMESKGKWGFAVEKVVDDAPHPQRKRIAMQHPNWGHPVLRNIDKKRIYLTIEDALADMALLQQEYPHVSVPGNHCLFIAVYGRVEDKKGKRVKRYVLEIEPVREGGYYLIAKEKKQKPKTKELPKSMKPKAPLPTADKPSEPMGFFASKVTLKRAKKTPK
jgi:hypothetical protein